MMADNSLQAFLQERGLVVRICDGAVTICDGDCENCEGEEDNADQVDRYDRRQGHLKLTDGTEIINAYRIGKIHGRRYDQVILADDRRREIMEHHRKDIAELLRRCQSSIIPEEFHLQFYDIDAEEDTPTPTMPMKTALNRIWEGMSEAEKIALVNSLYPPMPVPGITIGRGNMKGGGGPWIVG